MNIGLVGLGFMGKTHLRAYQQMENVQVRAICITSKGRDLKIEAPFDGIFVSEYEHLLRRKDIDVVDICLPTFLHEEAIIQAARAGKHIFCEKPLALSVQSAERIINEVKRHDVKLFVGHVLRFWPEYEKVKAYSKSNLKNIEIVHAKRLGQLPSWSSWFQYPEKSGGALFDLHIHDIDFAVYLLGKVEKVYAVGWQNSFGAWDHVMTTLEFKNGGKVFVEASHRMPVGYPFIMSFRAQSGQRTIEFEMKAGENIENIPESHHHFTIFDGMEKSAISVPQIDAFQRELTYFVECLEKNKENTVIPLADVIYTLKILEAIQHSLETGEVIHV